MKYTAHKHPQSRVYSPLDHLLMGIDAGVRTLFGQPKTTERPNPARNITETELSASERELAGRLMRKSTTQAKSPHRGSIKARRSPPGYPMCATRWGARHWKKMTISTGAKAASKKWAATSAF